MRRRHLWLLAVFVPTALGLAALSYLIFFAPDSRSEASPAAPIVRQAPRVEDAISDESVIAPLDSDALAPTAPVENEPVELPETKPESPDRPTQLESSDIIGAPMLASSAGTDSSTGAPAPLWSRRSLRPASLSATGGGGGAPSTNGFSKTSGDSAATPVEVSNSGNDDSSTAGGGSAAPDIPNPNPGDDHEDDENSGGNEEAEEDPPVSDTDPYPTNPFPHDGEHEPVPVPEPASFGLLLLGLAGCALGRRRKN